MRSILQILITVSLSFFIFSCEDKESGEDKESDSNLYGTLTFDMRLYEDTNGFYHLALDRDNWQTLHRVSATVVDADMNGIENFRMEWESNLYWFLGDTLGYVVKRGLTDNLVYVSYDTVYVTGFNGMEVPTSNQASYSNSKGELNNMIAPVRSMVGDTLLLTAKWGVGGKATFGIVLD